VYAQAKSKYQIENLKPDELPWEYRVKDFDYGDEASVRIMEHEILIPIPDGIDITAQCIMNLKEKIVAVEKQAKEDIKDLNDRIRNLALIEYKPDNDERDALVKEPIATFSP
jgi:hypothetical protein